MGSLVARLVPAVGRRASAGAFAVAVAVALVLLFERPARANVAQSSFDGDRYGALVARTEQTLRVDSEELFFDVAPDLTHARVTATYQFSNPSTEVRRADAAFVFTIGERPASSAEHAPTITIDGAPVKFTIVDDAAQLGPQLDAWIAAHPEAVGQAPASDREPTALRVLVEARDAGVQSDELVVRAAREVIPEAVAAMEKGWSTLGVPRRMKWLAFGLEVAPGATRTVAVAYTHVPGRELAKHVDTTFTYEYLLSPAKTWAGFGPLHVRLKLPPDTFVESPTPWRADGSELRADFPTLPEGELVFGLMSKKSTWFGMTSSGGYWAIVLAAIGAVTIAIGRTGGRMWAKGGTSGIASVGWAAGIVIVTGIAATFAAVVVPALFPARALGFGYEPLLGLVAAVGAACVGAGIVGVIARKRARSAR